MEDFLQFLPESEPEAHSDDRPVIIKQSQRDQKVYIRKFAPWLDPKKRYHTDALLRLDEEIHDFAKFISPTHQEHFARSSVVARVSELVDKIFNSNGRVLAKVHVFGSFETQLYLPSSDIDLVIEWNTEKTTDAVSKPPLKKLANALVSSQICAQGRCKTLLKARVPLIKFTDRITDFSVDISFNTKGTEGVRFINGLLNENYVLRPLILLLKQFLSQRALNEPYSGGVGSYSLICMIASFLKTHPLLQANLIDPKDNIAVLLLDFFELYGRNFNYENVGISILNKCYFDKEERGWQNDRRTSQLSIEDPQDQDNDICKSSFCFPNVKQAFEHAFKLLVHVITSRKYLDNDTSVLASILSVPEEVLRHRFYIKQVINYQ